MHSRQSLYDIHGISATPGLRLRVIAPRFGLARIVAFLKARATAIRKEMAARRASAELSGMSDHMLRDIGITRAEIESVVRHGTLSGPAPVILPEVGYIIPSITPRGPL